ncbi:MAG TPA: ATP-binding protein [Chitinophagales bacterium]|nr:ATP-binding protein [Chitinophagales bacterium]
MKTSFEKELMKTQVEVAENTLNDIARDLHDDVGQMLTFSIIQLNNIRPMPDAATEKNIAAARESVQNTLQSVRSISKTLSNDYLSSFGMEESLKRLFERIARQGIVRTTLVFPANVLFSSRSNEVFAFRIIQELVTNTLKHSGATELSLIISEADGNIQIEYSDNGKGLHGDQFNNEQLKNSLGFTNIFKRAELMHGEITISNNSEGGFYLRLSFPNK